MPGPVPATGSNGRSPFATRITKPSRLTGIWITRVSRTDLVDAGMLRPDEAVDHPNSNIITRAVGVAPDLRVDTVAGDARPGDQFLLASDGLTRMVDDQELVANLISATPDSAAEKLIETVLSRGAPDNVSLISASLP